MRLVVFVTVWRPAVMKHCRLTSLLVASFIIAACSSVEPEDHRVPAWSVSDLPLFSIGALDGDLAYLFQRIVAAHFAPDGRIVVADGALSVIRIFDAAGRFETEIGRAGEGPGEFRSLRDIWIAAPGTIGAWDSGARRFTYYDMSGSLLGTVPVGHTQDGGKVGNLDLMVGAFADQSIAVAALTFGNRDGTGADQVSIERFGPDGTYLGRLGRVTGLVRAGNGPIPFSPFPYFAVDSSSVYFTNGQTPEVLRWSSNGTQTLTFPTAEYDPNDAWSALAQALEERKDEWRRTLLDEAPRSDSLPHLAGLVVDDRGLVWTKSYDARTDAFWLSGGRVSGGLWWVADPLAGMVAVARMPSTLTPLEITSERVLGLAVDSLGVERVVVHGLAR